MKKKIALFVTLSTLLFAGLPAEAATELQINTTRKTIEIIQRTVDENKDLIFNQTGYVSCAVLNVRKKPNITSKILDKLTLNKETQYAIIDEKWAAIEINDIICYICRDFISDSPIEIVAVDPNPAPISNEVHLTREGGVFYGPMGKETYYNLPMQGVVNIMRGLGYTDAYWVRSDGCKMFGNYIMVAADLNRFPRGSIVQTSLGAGRVCDTGGFVYNGSGVAFDIATSW